MLPLQLQLLPLPLRLQLQKLLVANTITTTAMPLNET